MIKIKFNGQMGNNLFQYCFGRIVHEHTGLQMEQFQAGNVFENQSFFPEATFQAGEKREDGLVLFNDETNEYDILEKCLDLCKKENRGILLNGYFQNFKYYLPYRDKIKNWFKTSLPEEQTITKDDWIMHVRQDDYIQSGSQLTKSYYESILDSNSRTGRLFIIGKRINLDFLRFFESKYDAIYVQGNGIQDFIFMKSFKNMIGSNSTYSWWVAFLTEPRIVFMPKPAKGYWSESQSQKLLIPGFHTIIENDNSNNPFRF